jgi:hypothetical protein
MASESREKQSQSKPNSYRVLRMAQSAVDRALLEKTNPISASLNAHKCFSEKGL